MITSAGFQVLTGPTPVPPLVKPVIQKLVQKGTGEQQVFVGPQRGTRMLEIQSGEAGSNNAPPATWTTTQATSARPAPVVSGLTPGKVYVFQVRAYGKSGWTDWSDPVVKMTT